MLEERYRNSALSDIMNEFENANVNGLIIDLRQGSWDIDYLLAEYFLKEQGHFATLSRPLGFAPGVFVDFFRGYSGHGTVSSWGHDLDVSFSSFFHDQNIVILMNEHVQSHGEFTVMTINTGDNVTVMGTNTIGANGNVAFLPLPGEMVMMFTGLGVYTPDGGQTQRIGLSPDIYVPRTVEGIRDGRDVLMESAVEFLIERAM